MSVASCAASRFDRLAAADSAQISDVEPGVPALSNGADGAEQGIWLETGTPLPGELWLALFGQSSGGVPAADGAATIPAIPHDDAAEAPVAAGFGQGEALDGLAPGPELALLLPGAASFSRLGDDELTGVLRGWRRLGSWAAAVEHAAVAELAGRRIGEARSAGACLSEAERFAAAEVAAALTLTRYAAEGLVGRALLFTDLSATAEALADGVIDVPKALVIVNGVAGLENGVVRKVEAQVLPKAPAQTTGEFRQAVARAVMAAAPVAAQRRHDQAVKAARVERWAEAAGTGALAGRDLPAADVLAADNRINALAAALRADGAAGGIDLLRAQVFVGLLLGRPAAAPAHADAALGDPAADDGAGAVSGSPAAAADPADPADPADAALGNPAADPADAADAVHGDPAADDGAGAGAAAACGAPGGPVPGPVPGTGAGPDVPAPDAGGSDAGGTASDSGVGGGGDLGGAVAEEVAADGGWLAGVRRVAAGPVPSAAWPPGGWGRLAGSINLTVPLATL
jgi:hypothetical protein